MMTTISDDDAKSVLENPWAADDDCRVVELTITQEMSTCMYRELEGLNVTFDNFCTLVSSDCDKPDGANPCIGCNSSSSSVGGDINKANIIGGSSSSSSSITTSDLTSHLSPRSAT